MKRLTAALTARQDGRQPTRTSHRNTPRGRHWGHLAGVSLLLAAMATTMTACSSGGGGDNGVEPEPESSGAVFAYPYNGQQDVTLDSQIVVKFGQALSGDASKALALRAGSASAGNTSATISADSDGSNDQAGILTIAPDGDLKPDTTYYIVATQNLSGTKFGKGDTVVQFKTGPIPGRPAASDQLEVVETTPGNVNPVTNDKSVFTEFNSVRVVFSEPVEASSVVKGESFKFTNAAGDEVPGRLTVVGHRLTFDPSDDLEPGDYELTLSKDVKSKYGKSLAAYDETKTVLDGGQMSTENLTVKPSAQNVGDLPDNILDGGPVNLVTIGNQLIGLNQQPAMNVPARKGLTTTLAEGGQPGFGNTIAATIRGGQKFQLTPLSLKLDGAVPTPINSGPIQVQFANDADVYLKANDLNNVTEPTAVRLRFDLAISTLIEASADQKTSIIQSLANGVFNQTALNIQAAGLAIPQNNGDLKIDALGSFPILVNRTDRATVDFELSLTLSGANQVPVEDDTTPPFLVSQSPSACLYTFGTPAYDQAYAQAGGAPTSLPEQKCVQILQQGKAAATDSGISNFPIEASPALVFSEPIDPLTVNDDSIQLSYTTEDGASGTTSATYQVDGSSVVIDPEKLLEPGAQYTIQLGSGASIKDIAGNMLTQNTAGGPKNTIKFSTEPVPDRRPTPPFLGELTPGVPCALDGGDFASGGDTAGNCARDDAHKNDDDVDVAAYSVFKSPANVPVVASSSKLLSKDSIKLADGCLTSGGGDSNDVDGATVALEQVDNSGQCTGTPDADIAFANRNGDRTKSFSIEPTNDLEVGSRYQIVICGTEGSACSHTIVGADGMALNTDPFNGTATTNPDDAAKVAGGPDILMPFDVTEPTSDYYTTSFTLPGSDTNGNGELDDENGDGQYTAADHDERPQPGNRALVKLTAAGGGITIENENRDDGLFPTYLSLARPIAIRQTLDDCSPVTNVIDDDGNTVVGSKPDTCIQVSLLPGGLTAQTNIAATALGLVPINTGRLLLQFPNKTDDNGDDAGTQSGYIVPECSGTGPDGEKYDYSPCFVANLNLLANGPDDVNVELPRQYLGINVYGPVTFQQNGRLVISLRNANTFAIDANAPLDLSATATIEPGDLHYQLVGNAVHGGRAFPQR